MSVATQEIDLVRGYAQNCTSGRPVFFLCIDGTGPVMALPNNPRGLESTSKQAEIWWDNAGRGARVWEVKRVMRKDGSLVRVDVRMIRSK